MKIRRLLAGILILSLLGAVAVGCRKTPETPAQTEAPSEVPATEEPTTEEPTTEDPLAAVGIHEDNSYRAAAMDKAAVIAFYTETLNDVKNRCPGYTRTLTHDVTDVTAGKGKLELANRIMNLIVTKLTDAAGDTDDVVTLEPFNDVAVQQTFPVFGETYGCDLTDLSVLESAFCYTDGATYKLIIRVRDTLNPVPGQDEFSKIMTPIDRSGVAGGIAGFLSGLDDRYGLFDFDYADNEITCIVDRETGRILSLTQRMVIHVDIDLTVGLFFFSGTVLEAHGTVVHKLEYTDFVWE